MVDPLAPLLADGVIDEVVSRLKSGKEADLWLVRHGAELVAAKVYKARETRSFKNNADYKEGRQVRNTRTQRAMTRGSRFGQAAEEEAWKSKEADALHALHAAGVRVPRPVLFYQGVLLMELVVDPDGHPAPRLIDAHVEREHAAELYADLRAQVVKMLTCDLIHGDLSPYNILGGWSGPVIIDFPQVIGAAHNSQAFRFFQRDLENVRNFFAAVDPALRAASGDAREIWRAYERRELRPDFVPSGRAPEPAHHREHVPERKEHRREQVPQHRDQPASRREHAQPPARREQVSHRREQPQQQHREPAPARREYVPSQHRGQTPHRREQIAQAAKPGREQAPQRREQAAPRREHPQQRQSSGPQVIRVERRPQAAPPHPAHAAAPQPAVPRTPARDQGKPTGGADGHARHGRSRRRRRRGGGPAQGQ
ncbi:MAG TPA: RIO1 family regulatory kinase/ATPase [Anaeromyxobacteraceae bacterium]|nr:RIO1 family regulatory kinase/ATPase [Anaeromyxobacteraceae bacterium]